MESIFYFAELCDDVYNISMIIGIIIALVSAGCWCLYFLEREEPLKKGSIRASILALFFLFVGAIVPSKETYIFMKAGKCVDDAVISNPEVRKLPENAILLLNEYIKRELKEKEE